MPELEQPKTAAARTPYLDALRVIAFVAVAMIHVTAPRVLLLPVGGAGWLANTAYNSLSRFAVPVFFMVSGALWLDPNRPFDFSRMLKKNVLRLATAWLFWSLVYAVAEGYWRADGDGMLSKLLHFAFSVLWRGDHLWFIPALVAVYLLVPFLRNIAADRKLLSYYLLLWGAVCVLAGTLQSMGLMPDTFVRMVDGVQLRFVLGYTGYFLLGYWLSTAVITRPARGVLYLSGVLCAAATFFATWLFSVRDGKVYSNWLDDLNTPFTVLASVAVFVLVRYAYEGRTLSPRRTSRLFALGKLSFGAYLVHLLFILPSQYGRIPGLFELGVPYGLEVPLFTLLVAALSFAASWVLNRIPFVNRYLV